MRIIKSPEEMAGYAQKAKCRGQTIGFVPTMGCLHNGHRSLIEAAKVKSNLVVVSIFVNPIQFGQGEDLSRYPRDLRRDEKMLKELEVDVLFIPPADKMYKGDFKTYVDVETL
ncbi:MAG: pantoate--beta-alanine ligase, partial [Candidatus Margulisiibacteriota bacterium]